MIPTESGSKPGKLHLDIFTSCGVFKLFNNIGHNLKIIACKATLTVISYYSWQLLVYKMILVFIKLFWLIHLLVIFCAEPHGGQDPRTRAHTSLVVVLIIMVISTLMVMGFFFYKKSPRPLPTFDNPLYFGSERSQPDVVDTNKLIENAEVHVENPEPIITLWLTNQ